MRSEEVFVPIAFSADLHLTTRQRHPERYHALEDILQKMMHHDTQTLILVGDTFDETGRNYAEFDAFCTQEGYRQIHFIVLPGNHDAGLQQALFTAQNIQIVEKPTVLKFAEKGLDFVLLPYAHGVSMGEAALSVTSRVSADRWVLVGHGDWSAGMHEPNPDEPGVYMPLTRGDIENLRPRAAILGHIHKPMDSGKVHYIGSPCGLDIRETGRRRFFILDAESGAITPEVVDTDFLYFNESFVVLPVADEEAYVAAQIQERMAGWQLTPEEQQKVRLLSRFRGYSNNKKRLQEIVCQCLAPICYYKDIEPDFADVAVADDSNRSEVARRISEHVERLEMPAGEFEVRRDDVLLEALHVIYGD